MVEIKSCKTEVLVFSLPWAPVWIIRVPSGGCPWSVKFQGARLRVSPPPQATVSPSQSPSNNHLEGRGLQWVSPVITEGGTVSFPFWGAFRTCHSPRLCPACSGTTHSHFRAWAPSNRDEKGQCSVVFARCGFQAWIFAWVPTSWRLSRNHFFFPPLSKIIILLRIVKLNKIWYIKFPEISNT